MTELRPDDLRSDFYNRTGEQALIEFSVSCSDIAFKTQTIEMPAIEYMKHLEQMVIALKEALRWRPVSEKPEKYGWYLCKVKYVDNTIGEETVNFDGERFVFGNVVKWLPIPPAPEGE